MRHFFRTFLGAAALALVLAPSVSSQAADKFFYRAKPGLLTDPASSGNPGGTPGEDTGGTPGGEPSPEPNPVTLSLASATMPEGDVDALWEFDFQPLLEVTGIEKADVNWSNVLWSFASTSKHPDWLVIDTMEPGVVAGAPEASGSYSFDLVASYEGKQAQRTYRVYVNGVYIEAVQISGGGDFTCAVTVSGAAKCWGKNNTGQLGNGVIGDTKAPVPVVGLGSGVTSISAGLTHACAVTDEGAAYCWGSGSNGRLGNGTTAMSRVPVAVSGLGAGTTASINAGGSHTCAVMTDGSAKCWGAGSYGRLGNGQTIDFSVPQNVDNLGTVIAIELGENHSCALLAGNSARCWGLGSLGRLATGATTSVSIPTPVVMADGTVKDIATLQADTCLLSTSGAVKCWGNSYSGTAGSNPSGFQGGVTMIDGGTSHFCGIVSGTAKCFGTSSKGQASGSVADAVGVTAGTEHSCAIKADKSTYCWGSAYAGQLGDPLLTVTQTSGARQVYAK